MYLPHYSNVQIFGLYFLWICLYSFQATQAQEASLNDLKSLGAKQSRFLHQKTPEQQKLPKPRLTLYRNKIEPILRTACLDCHGEDTQEGNVRVDTLDPNLFSGADVDWWLEVLAVLTNGEMPPPDEGELSPADRSQIVEWLSTEIHNASRNRRATKTQSSFRRLTRYEYNYALQDLLGLERDFAKDLPPEPISEHGFQNSSEMLHMSSTQFDTYRESALKALKKATVRGPRPPHLYWGVSMKDASQRVWKKHAEEEKLRERHKDDPEKLKQALERHAKNARRRHGGTYYQDQETGYTARASWSYGGAKYAHAPSDVLPNIPTNQGVVAVIPPKQRLIVELGDRVPESGNLRVRVRASRTSTDTRVPYLQLEFGWQASNDSHASVRISKEDLAIEALPGNPEFYEWNVPTTEIYPRNSVRHINKMGDLPSPSEYIKFINASDAEGDVQIDYVEVTTPTYGQWPPLSHTKIFFDSEHADLASTETAYAKEILNRFMPRAWREPVNEEDINQKAQLFAKIRPTCDDFQEAMLEVLATVLSSPKFLYLTEGRQGVRSNSSVGKRQPIRSQQFELATRLSMFLWCSIPDDELRLLAAGGTLNQPEVLAGQVERMLGDEKARRFEEQFVRQWLGLSLLDYLDVDRKAFPHFDRPLKDAMQKEPVAFFHELLRNNASVLDFLHAEYTVANERLARHYGLDNVYGNDFRRVRLGPAHSRGGLLTQPGLLAMNSDGLDSHPLKRGIWLLEKLLNDPPPPPPPAVPEIDLADPEIAKLSLKERIEDHRNDPACMSCHQKIDPWGIAMEDFDAVGSFRTQVKGKPVDSTSRLFNGSKLAGIDGLKRYLLMERQDQFVRALVYKMTTYALGRPLTFSDRSALDEITAKVRSDGDGLASMVRIIVGSSLFRGADSSR